MTLALITIKLSLPMSTDSSANILLIDGIDQDREYYAKRLTVCSPDYRIFEAATAQTGLNFCIAHVIDCVVLQLDLPDMSGFEVLLKLVPVARYPKVAVIVLTRLTNQSLLDMAVQNGAQAYLIKSRTSGDLLDKFIFKAISTVQRDRKRAMLATLPNTSFALDWLA
jgi:DNA-binding NarL/FixJ family response regulator